MRLYAASIETITILRGHCCNSKVHIPFLSISFYKIKKNHVSRESHICLLSFKARVSSQLECVRYVCRYNFAVRSVSSKNVFAHHADTHLAPRLVLADHHAHGKIYGLHFTNWNPVREYAAIFDLFHGYIEAAAGERREKESHEWVRTTDLLKSASI